jgi:hypothetical protein
LWPVPLGFALVGMIAWRLDRRSGWTLLNFEPEAATALIAAIVGAVLTFLGTAFAVLLSHSVQGHPQAIEEIRRILLEHASTPGGGSR